MGKKQGKNKQAWLDWLADEPPAVGAQAELRERFKQQANGYRPVDRTRAPQPAGPAMPLRQAPQTQAATPSVASAKTATSQPAAPATVSIQIHIPAFHTERFKRGIAKLKQWAGQFKDWLRQAGVWLWNQARMQYQEHRGRTVGTAVVVLLLLIAPLGFALFHGAKTAGGSSGGTAGGAAAKKQAKPTYEVVRPSNKPNLATPDGKNAAYDSSRQEYSYRDSIGTNGFTVSQQPVPAKFGTGQLAVNAIAPTVMKGITPVKLNIITGAAEVSTNPNNGSQIVVASVRTLLIFIQSGHQFTTTEWEDYLNTLQ